MTRASFGLRIRQDAQNAEEKVAATSAGSATGALSTIGGRPRAMIATANNAAKPPMRKTRRATVMKGAFLFDRLPHHTVFARIGRGRSRRGLRLARFGLYAAGAIGYAAADRARRQAPARTRPLSKV
jgi:hypothetical protein